MERYFKKNLAYLSFVFIPIVFFWHPNWLGLFGNQPYWPLFWLLPWSMIYGSINGFILGLFLGLLLDSISLESSFTQIPGLIICGVWFGRFKTCRNVLVDHFRYGLICSVGSFFCGSLYFFQILIKNHLNNYFTFLEPNIKNILTQILLTGLFAPLICSQLLKVFRLSKVKN